MLYKEILKISRWEW